MCLLLKDLIKFNTNDKKLETKLKDSTSKGLVFNSLKARWNYLKKLEIFQCESHQFLDFIAEDQDEKRWISYDRLLKLLKIHYTDSESSMHKEILRSFLLDLELFKTFRDKGQIKKFLAIYDFKEMREMPDLMEMDDD